MKAALLALAASSLLGSAAAGQHDIHLNLHDRRHKQLEARDSANASCGCTTYTTTWYGEATLVPDMPPLAANSTVPESTAAAVVPTPSVTTIASPGTYTITASTITLTDTVTVPAATTTELTSGVNTYGGLTTSVSDSTTLTAPWAAVETTNSVTNSVISTTTYVCPSAGTYTPVAPATTSVDSSSTLVYPVPTSYAPGTYTIPEQTITITTTSYVFVCPYTTVSPSSSSVYVAPSSAAPVETSSAAPIWASSAAPVETSAAPSSYAPASSSEAASSWAPESSSYAPASSSEAASSWAPASSSYVAPSSSVASSSSAPSASSTGGIVTNGNQWAMTYTPYDDSGACKSSSDVSSDIADIAGKGFTTVRVYSTDCSTLENVGSACSSNGLKMILGVFIESSGIEGARDQVTEIVNWGSSGNWDMVTMLVIGNEAIFNGYCSASDLASFISEVKSTVKSAGYSGPCTTTDTLATLQESGSALCSVMDVVAANIQPFFNPSVSAADAGSFVAQQLSDLQAICPDLEAYNLECGWPSEGSSNGAAVPGTSEQAQAISAIVSQAGTHSVIFSFQNDGWKDGGEFGVEKYWGASQCFSG